MLNYEEIKKIKIKENIEYFKNNFKNKDYQLKIDKYCNKFGISKTEILQRIQDGDLITLSIFSKDPSKQNFYEKTAAEYIKQIDGVEDFVNLPNSGANAIFMVMDTIRKKGDIKRELPSKSIDFVWKFKVNKIIYYAYHKYINENGGAQDNQYNDVLYSIVAARSKSDNNKHKVLFICDGAYFNKKRIKILKDASTNHNHKVLNIEEVETYLNNDH